MTGNLLGLFRLLSCLLGRLLCLLYGLLFLGRCRLGVFRLCAFLLQIFLRLPQLCHLGFKFLQIFRQALLLLLLFNFLESLNFLLNFLSGFLHVLESFLLFIRSRIRPFFRSLSCVLKISTRLYLLTDGFLKLF